MTTVRVMLSFDLPESELHKLIPCVSIYAEIFTAEGITEIVHDAPGEGITAKGTNAILTARTGIKS